MSLIRNRPLLSLKKTAFAFQKDALEIIKDSEYFAIFHEQGLGKTKIAIDLIFYWLQNNIIESVLIVSKKSLVNNWDRELDFHGNLLPIILGNKEWSGAEFNPG